MKLRQLWLTAAVCIAPAILTRQGRGVTAEEFLKPLKDSWPTYNGDPRGNRYTTAKEISKETIARLTPLWVFPVPGARAS